MNVSVKAKESINIKINDKLVSYEVPVMHKREFKTKNMNQCNGHPLKPGNQVCIYFSKISNICLIIGKVEDHSSWEIKGNCGIEWKEQLADSSEYVQEVDFYDYPI